jgi:hypothetical protein
MAEMRALFTLSASAGAIEARIASASRANATGSRFM